MKRTVIVAYIPVLHLGYFDFLANRVGVDTLYVIGSDFAESFPELDYIYRKDAIRALPAGMIKEMVELWGLVQKVEIFDHEQARSLQKEDVRIVLLDEDITRSVAQRYFFDSDVEFKTAAVRWHRNNVLEEKAVSVHRSVPVSKLDQELMQVAVLESERSWDWWRQVGAVVVKNNEPILVAHNQHVPDEQMPYSVGDPRSIFSRGVHLELSSADHAEAILIGEAARRGISLEGTSLYVTDFPCPPCAKLIARAGITRCYFTKGYAVLDGEETMKGKVELIFVETK